MMSNSDELRTGNIVYVSADRELKIDFTKSSPEASSTMRGLASARCTDVRLYT